MAEEANNKPARRTERIGKYEILGHIATGGMGVIYKARDTALDRLVALKILPAELAAQQVTLVRFEREARAAARLRHENIVTIFEFGEVNGTHYIALEFIEGTDLQAYINRKCKLDPEEARQIIIQAARALAHAHEQKIVHRDIKPSNFLLTRKDKRFVVKLTDFGLAIRHESDAEFRITRDKTTVGTVDYMSPEQARDSRSADIRSDIYSLGCTFFHMLAGNAPFARGTMPERIVQHMQAPPPDVRKLNPSIPAAFTRIINKMLAKKPEDRYQTPAELLHDLEHPEQVAAKKPAAGKLGDGMPRKGPERTAVIEAKELNEESDEPAQLKAIAPAGAELEDEEEEIEEEKIEAERPVRRIKFKKPTPVPIVGPPRQEAAVELPESNTREVEMDDAGSAATDAGADLDADADADADADVDVEEPKTEEAKKAPAGSPVWMYATAASVGVLGLVLMSALMFGGKPPPKKDVETPTQKKPEQTAAVEPPTPEDPVEPPTPMPPAIDTSPAKMGVGMLDLPIMDPVAVKPNRAALHKEFFGPFTNYPEVPQDAAVVRMSRLATGASAQRTLADAVAQAKPNSFTIVEIQDNGPIFVPALPTLMQRSILIRAAAGYRPLIVWDVPSNPAADKPAAVFASLGRGKLMLEGLDFVVQWPGDGPAAWFDLTGSDFFARDCTFSAGSKNGQPVALVRRRENASFTDKTTQTWLQHCYVRGPDVALLQLQAAGGDLMIEESLIVGQQQPLIDMRCHDFDALAMYCVRSTLAGGRNLLHWEPIAGKPGRPRLKVQVLDSILSRHDSAGPFGDMVHLAGRSDAGLLSWRGVNTAYAGWKQLLASGSKNIGGHDLASWRQQMGEFTGASAALVDNWPRGVAGLEEQPAAAFLPATSPVSFAALTGSGSIGCIIGRLPKAPENWRESVGEQRKVPLVPIADAEPAIDPAADGLFHGEVLDLNKVDLAQHLRMIQQTRRLAPRVVLILEGKGPCITGPVQVAGIEKLILHFKQPDDPKAALTLELNAPQPLLRPPMFEMTGGRLELIGLNVRLSPATLVPTIVHVKNGDLSMTRCRLQGPLTASAESFQSLVTVSNADGPATTLLLRDNVFASGKLLIQLDNNVQLKARNNVLLSLGDAIHMDATRPTAPVMHLLDHNTLAARNNCFVLRTGPGFEPTGTALLHASHNALLHPFTDGDATLLRGGQAWVGSGHWSWQGRYNVYDTRWQTYLHGSLDQPAARQKLADWKAAWGQIAEQNAIPFDVGAAGKTIPADNLTPPALLQMLDRLALPPNLRGDPVQSPPGADLFSLRILKKKA